MNYSKAQLIDALQKEYEYLIHDDFDPFEDITAEQHLEWLHTLSQENLIYATHTDENYTLEQYMENWG